MSVHQDIVQVQNPDALAEEAARRFVELAGGAGGEGFRVALSGGSTPKTMYAHLSTQPYMKQVDWTKVQVFFSDERFVPPDSDESNYHLAQSNLLSKVPVSRENVHPVPTVDVSPQEAAARYEATIRQVFGAEGSEVPRFDLVFLGLGPDGHTASLFPGTDALSISDRLVAANFVPRLDTWRITFTYPLINAARHVMFLVQGQDKAERVHEVLSGQGNLPAEGVRPADGALTWLLDAAAAAKVPAGSGESLGGNG